MKRLIVVLAAVFTFGIMVSVAAAKEYIEDDVDVIEAKQEIIAVIVELKSQRYDLKWDTGFYASTGLSDKLGSFQAGIF